MRGKNNQKPRRPKKIKYINSVTWNIQTHELSLNWSLFLLRCFDHQVGSAAGLKLYVGPREIDEIMLSNPPTIHPPPHPLLTPASHMGSWGIFPLHNLGRRSKWTKHYCVYFLFFPHWQGNELHTTRVLECCFFQNAFQTLGPLTQDCMFVLWREGRIRERSLIRLHDLSRGQKPTLNTYCTGFKQLIQIELCYLVRWK